MVTLWTAPLKVRGPDVVDVSRKSGLDAFAPSWPLLQRAISARRAGTVTPALLASYRLAYLAEMRTSYRVHREAWDALLARERAVLTCYCTRPEHASGCHRIILAWLLCQLGAVYRGEVRGPDRVAWALIGGPGEEERAVAHVQTLPAGAVLVHGDSAGAEQAAAVAAQARGLQTLCLPLTPRMVKRWGEPRARRWRDLWLLRAADCMTILPSAEERWGRVQSAAFMWGIPADISR